MADEPRHDPDGKKRFRSPPYPQISLSKAIERARELYQQVHRHPASVPVVAGAWGIKETTGALWTTAASLIQYGLVADEGTGDKRKFQLTESAFRILLDPDPSSKKHRAAIQRAAIAPMIHAELWERFDGATNVSDALLKGYLTLDRQEEGKSPYSDNAAEDVIRIYRDAITFAGLVDNGVISSQSDERPAVHSGSSSVSDEAGIVNTEQQPEIREDYSQGGRPSGHSFRPTAEAGERELTSGLLSRGASFRLIVSGRVGAKEIERLIKKLELDKEILADPDDDESDAM